MSLRPTWIFRKKISENSVKQRLVGLTLYESATILLLTDDNLYGIGGQQFFYQLWPFNETEGTGVEIVLVAHVVHLFQLLDAVEVEVVDLK